MSHISGEAAVNSLINLIIRVLVRFFHPLTVIGLENIPRRQGALLVLNHASRADVPALEASLRRRARFVHLPGSGNLSGFPRRSQVISGGSSTEAHDLDAVVAEAKAAIQRGEIVCIFPEGTMGRTGFLQPFTRFSSSVIERLGVPIHPAYIDPPRGGLLGLRESGVGWKSSRLGRVPVTICFGRALPENSTSFAVREAILDLGSTSWNVRKARMKTLDRSFVRNARRHPFRFAMADAKVSGLSFSAALVKVVFLARRLRVIWSGQEMVGVMLPPSVPGQLVNLAALLSGKIPVHLNYTSSADTLDSCASQCGLRTVVTSRQFLEKLPAHVPAKAIFLEDVAAHPRALEKIAAMASAFFLPARWLERSLGRSHSGTPDGIATVIFSSGSTGDPKGVVLTHFNIAANLEQVSSVFAFRPDDRLLSVLPFFHSFGFTINGMLPALRGFGAVFHPNPLDAVSIGALAGKHAATILVGPPTFLQSYVRRCASGDFSSLRIVIAGAEKLSPQLAKEFGDRFGTRPLEGYGTTECAPVVTVNAFDVQTPEGIQKGSKSSTIGRPLPGMSMRIVDPETFAPLPPGKPGMLLLRGPNVMMGYLGRPEKTAEVMRDGWYVTGDIVTCDDEGFVAIMDRLSRFSKIGGEMVPHVRIEDALHQLAGANARVFAVTAVPDKRKGEVLVVFHTLEEEALRACLDRMQELGLPNLWVPRRQHFFRVESFPSLGTGKLDLRRLKELGVEMVRQEAA